MLSAKADHRKSHGGQGAVFKVHGRQQFPDVFVVKVHDCDVTAAANPRQFHIYADEKAVAWIQTAPESCDGLSPC